MVARIVFGMMQSLDGYVAGLPGGPQIDPPGEALHRYWNRHMREVTGAIYGREMYDIMSYWDSDQPGWSEVEHDFAAAWRPARKWVVSRTLSTVGPNAELLTGDLGEAVRRVRDSHEGEIEVAGPTLAASLSELGLIDEYRLYLMPAVLGGGKPFFAAAPAAPLRFIGSEILPEGVPLLRYAGERATGG